MGLGIERNVMRFSVERIMLRRLDVPYELQTRCEIIGFICSYDISYL